VLDWQGLQQFITEHHVHQTELWIALSGGIDSVCLLHLAKELHFNTGVTVKAIHVNHGLSPNANAWQQQVSSLCDRLGIELVTQQVHIETKTRTSLEHQARDARYQVIAEQLPEGSVLFTGHHQADQFETFILRLMRGSGLTGLSSMRPISDLPNVLAQEKQLKLARPLLDITKSDILNYAQKHNLTWVEDESNQDQKFDRNFVRGTLLPAFLQRWSNATSAVENTTSLLQQESDLLNEYLEQDLQKVEVEGFAKLPTLDLTQIRGLSINKQSALVRLFVYKQVGQYPSRNCLNELLHNQINSRTDSQPEIKLNQRYSLNVYDNKLFVTRLIGNDFSGFELIVNTHYQFIENRLYQSILVEIDSQSSVTVTFGNLSDKLKPNENSGSKKVKEILKQFKCPPWLRVEVPLIYLDEKLVAVGDLVVDKDFYLIDGHHRYDALTELDIEMVRVFVVNDSIENVVKTFDAYRDFQPAYDVEEAGH